MSLVGFAGRRSVKTPFSSNVAQLRGCHEPSLRHPDGGKGSIQIMRPEIQELDKFRKPWRQVVVLPDIDLHDVSEVRHAVGDFCRRKTQSPQLTFKISSAHVG